MATTYDKASLVMIPSGYKDDKLYSIKPTDGSGDFTFSRDGAGASPATRVNASGLIEKGRTNIALSSNDISTQSTYWSANQGGVTTQNSATAPDGSATASTITATGVNTYSGVSQGITMSGLRYTYSVYLKAVSGTPDIRLTCFDGSTFHQQDFTLSTSWERYSITFSPNAGTNNVYITSTQAVSWNAWGAQLELGQVPTELIETTTAPVSAGLLGDMPRLDYSGGATCPSLLLEPSRVNLVANSEYFPTFFSGLSVTQNATTSPEGVTNATKAVELSGTNGKAITLDSVSYTSGTTYTHSFFAKSSNRYIQMYFSNSLFTNDHANFDLVNGVVGGKSNDVTSSIEDYGNGWYRCTTTITAPATGSVSNLLLLVDDVNATRGQAYTGDGSSFVEVYGMQVEAGSYPTSYIPTYGSASTRGADNCYKDSLSVFGTNEGSFFVDVEGPNYNGSGANYLFDLSDNSSDLVNRFAVYSINQTTLNIFTNGGNSFTLDASTRKKILVIWNGTNTKVYANGTKVLDFTYANANPTSINLNSRFTDAEYGKSNYNQAIAFPTALTDSEAIALTTI